jgi:hypothetical protein
MHPFLAGGLRQIVQARCRRRSQKVFVDAIIVALMKMFFNIESK